MRVTLFLLILNCLFGVILWVTLSGALLILGLLLLLIFVVVSVGYSDTAILFFLGAREVKSSDEADFHSAADQEAYKLSVPRPKLYYYNGTLERAFVLQNKKTISLVLNRELIDVCTKDELAAICFELLLQVKKNLAVKRTKVMFLVGMLTWLSCGFVELVIKVVPSKELKQAMNWLMYYLLHPWIEVMFRLTLGEKYFKKLEVFLKDYPVENDLLQKVGSKLKINNEIYSLSSRKLIEFASVSKSRHYQNIIALELLPHEWDLIFDIKIGARA